VRWGALGGVLVTACSKGPNDATATSGTALAREVRSTEAGTAPLLEVCTDECTPLAVGETAQEGELRTSRTTVATLDLGGGIRIVLAPSTRVRAKGDGTVLVEQGTLTLDAPSGAHAAVELGAQRVEQDPVKALRLVASADEDDASVTVHRGLARSVGAGEPTTIDKGQSLNLAMETGAVAKPTYEPPRATPELAAVSDARPVSRGLGRMTARVPGQTGVVEGVHLASHAVNVVIRGGIATTTVEEVFENDTARLLEGRLVFPVPPDANVSRLALWVGDKLVEGEMVERPKAAAIFKNIVDDTVRPRDPALLEWTQGSELSLKIFPMPVHGSRKVVFSYEQPIDDVSGTARYVYPLSSGAERATEIGKFSFSVRVESERAYDLATPSFDGAVVNEGGATWVGFTREHFVPTADLEVGWKLPSTSDAVADVDDAGARAFLLRARASVDPSQPVPASVRGPRVLVFDQSASQTVETLHGQAELARAILESLDDGEPFALLSCDSACASYPEDGTTRATPEMASSAIRWLTAREPAGASDVAGAIQAGLERAGAGGQVLYAGDGIPSAGELFLPAMLERLSDVASSDVDVRLVGAGRTVDELVLQGLAQGLGATYERYDASLGDPGRASEIALALAQPVIKNLTVQLPAGAAAVGLVPRALRVGEELRIAGVGAPQGGSLVLAGTLGGQRYERTLPITSRSAKGASVGRAVARARIDELTRQGDPAFDADIIDLSKRFFVMTRKTSLLVLENDSMFSAFGITRTRGEESDVAKQDREPGSLPGGSESDAPPSSISTPFMLGGQGDAFGAGGLGLSGVGEGGGGRGELGLGSIGTLGHGAGSGTGEGFGHGDGRLSGEHRVKPPSVRMGATSVSGRLPPEVIQRIVRQNFGRFRLCYEKGLRVNPALGGRVEVRFQIQRDGSVSAISATGTLADASVTACVGAAFRQLSFPQPEGGTVIVSYPILFSNDGGPVAKNARSSTWQSGSFAWSSRPSAAFVPADDRWMAEGSTTLVPLEEAVRNDPERRAPRVALVHGLLARGRFVEARTEADKFVALDPDLATARELLAQAAVAAGDVDAAALALDSMVELSAGSATAHRRAATAFEARGDGRRACAHWISAASLDRSATSEAWRCRTRALGERESVRRDMLASGMSEVAAKETIDGYLNQKARTLPSAFESLGVTATCASGVECPSFASIDGAGNVVSPLVPDAFGRPFPITRAGVYRTVLVGGDASATVKLTAAVRGSTRSVSLTRGERQTALTTQVGI